VRTIFDSSEKVTVYHQQRYSGWVQRGISGREHQVLGSLLDEMSRLERILDLPCGYGRFTEQLLPRTDCLLSFDLSQHMVLHVAQKMEELRSAVGGEAGQGFCAGASSVQLPLPDKSVDLSVAIRLFQHLHKAEQRVATLREFGRVSRQRVIVTFYRSGTLHQAQRLIKKVKPGIKQITFRSFEQFGKEAGEAGLELERVIKLKRMVHSQTFAVLRPIG